MAKKNKGAQGKHAAHAAQDTSRSKGALAGREATASNASWQRFDENAANQGPVTYATSANGYGRANADTYKTKRNQQKHTHKRLGIALGIIVAILVIVYGAGIAFFSGHYLPNTSIGDEDISLSTPDDVASGLQAKAQDYTVQVSGEGLDFSVNATDSGVNIDADGVAQQALQATPAWQWPVAAFQSRDYGYLLQYAYDDSTLGKTVKTAVDAVNKMAKNPTNATISYDATQNKFAVQKEKAGTKLDYDKVLAKVTQSISVMDSNVEIGDDELQQPSVTSSDERLTTAAGKANSYLNANVKLTLSGKKVGTVDADQISQWVTLDKDLNPSFDSDAVKTWVANLASKVDTVGSKRTVSNSNGGTYTVSGGDYGWAIDQDSLAKQITDAVQNGTSGTIKVPCTSEGKTYSKNGNDIGKRYVDVDLSTQHAVFYVNGKSVWSADVVTGKPDGEHETPEGVYYIKNKESPSTLIGQMVPDTNKPAYETKVSYWMPFVENYIGFHDATWQAAFGGTRYKDGYGSHGCVNLSESSAGKLYDVIQIGDPVVVHK
jgi:lipoprotein-anchoring transpeptidase ErfK/SrfK